MALPRKRSLLTHLSSQKGSILLPVLLVFTTVLSIAGGLAASSLAQIQHYKTLENYYRKEAMVEFGMLNSLLSIETQDEQSGGSIFNRTE